MRKRLSVQRVTVVAHSGQSSQLLFDHNNTNVHFLPAVARITLVLVPQVDLPNEPRAATTGRASLIGRWLPQLDLVCGLAIRVSPVERGTAPRLNIDAEMTLVQAWQRTTKEVGDNICITLSPPKKQFPIRQAWAYPESSGEVPMHYRQGL